MRCARRREPHRRVDGEYYRTTRPQCAVTPYYFRKASSRRLAPCGRMARCVTVKKRVRRAESGVRSSVFRVQTSQSQSPEWYTHIHTTLCSKMHRNPTHRPAQSTVIINGGALSFGHRDTRICYFKYYFSKIRGTTRARRVATCTPRSLEGSVDPPSSVRPARQASGAARRKLPLTAPRGVARRTRRSAARRGAAHRTAPRRRPA